MHCVAHRLALAVGDAGKTTMDINLKLTTLDSLHRYYEKSHVHTSGLETIQASLLLILHSL